MSPPTGSEYNRVGDTTPLVPFVGVAVLVAFGLMAATQACLLAGEGVRRDRRGGRIGGRDAADVRGCGAGLRRLDREVLPTEAAAPRSGIAGDVSIAAGVGGDGVGFIRVVAAEEGAVSDCARLDFQVESVGAGLGLEIRLGGVGSVPRREPWRSAGCSTANPGCRRRWRRRRECCRSYRKQRRWRYPNRFRQSAPRRLPTPQTHAY